jgi:hypothetical protein
VVGRRCRVAILVLRQLTTNLETFRQGAEQGGTFPGQHASQPVSHASQDGLASARGFEPPLPRGVMGKHGLGAAGEFVCECFRDGAWMNAHEDLIDIFATGWIRDLIAVFCERNHWGLKMLCAMFPSS